jgi:hypothetical protein
MYEMMEVVNGLQEVKSLCLMQVSHMVQPERNVAENYVLKMNFSFLTNITQIQ